MEKVILDHIGLNDAYFKKLIQTNEEVLPFLLKEICGIEVEFKDIQMLNVESISEVSLKTSRFDINIKVNNTRIDIENEKISKGNDDYYLNRKFFYLAKLHSNSYAVGERYNETKKSVVIFIYNFDMGNVNFISEYHMVNRRENKESDILKVYDVNLAKIKENATIELERLFDLLKSKDITNYIKDSNSMIRGVANMLNTYDKDEILRLQAEQRDDDLRKYLTEMDWAKSEGKKEVAKKLLESGMSIEEVSKMTDLSIEELKKL